MRMRFWRARLMRAALMAVLVVPSVFAAELMTKVKVGDQAPDFTLPDQNNKLVKLSDFRGKKNVVLAFYVLAFTAG